MSLRALLRGISLNKLRRKQKGLFHFFTIIIASFFMLFVTLVFIGCAGDDDYLFLLMSRSSDPSRVSTLVTSKKGASAAGGIAPESNTQTTTDGSGLNLLLIDKLDESYVKELLSLYRDSQNGKIDNQPYHLSVEALLGMHVNEVGFYANTQIPESFVPSKTDNGKTEILWKQAYGGVAADDISLLRIDSTVKPSLPDNGMNSSAGINCFQFEAATGCSKSILNGAGNSGRSKGDKYFLPDEVATENEWLSNAMNGYFKGEKASDTQASAIASISHNRGASALGMTAYGIAYSTRGDSGRVDTSKDSTSNFMKYATYMADAYNSYSSGHSFDKNGIVKGTGSDYGRWYAVAICAKQDDYYFSKAVLDSISGVSVSAWNIIWPDDKVNSESDLKKRLQTKCMGLNKAIKETTGKSVSATDTLSVYGTKSDYRDAPYVSQAGRNFGWIYHVEKTTSPAYKHKYSDGSEPYVVECIDIVCCGQQVSVMLLGKYIYGNLLKISGLVSVDPTNPDTYTEKLQESDTYVPGA